MVTTSTKPSSYASRKLCSRLHGKAANRTRLPTKDEVARTPRLVKVLRLESYEDCAAQSRHGRNAGGERGEGGGISGALGAESHRLHYLARLPLEASASMLQTARLDHPFRYTLEILTDDGAETRTVDLVETFNWLLGLDVQRLRHWQHEKRDYFAVMGRYRVNKTRTRGLARHVGPRPQGRASLPRKAGRRVDEGHTFRPDARQRRLRCARLRKSGRAIQATHGSRVIAWPNPRKPL